MTQPRKPSGPGEWRKGDYLLVVAADSYLRSEGLDNGSIVRLRANEDDYIDLADLPYRQGTLPHRLQFLARPVENDPEGWVRHDGGPNPAPGMRVDVRLAWDNGPVEVQNEMSDYLNWGLVGKAAILFWRPSTEPTSSPAPEAGGGEHVKVLNDHAANSDDPLTSMLRSVAERLDRDPPDVFGAKVALAGARLAVSINATVTLPTSPEPVSKSPENEHGDGLEVVGYRRRRRNPVTGQPGGWTAAVYSAPGYDDVEPLVTRASAATALEAANRRIAELEGALTTLEAERQRPGVRLVHLQRAVAVQARAFLQQGVK